ncbi:Extracellular sulfatase Sulf-1 [Toxocara canis]|uniref:Extracellular sulfatase Sulf-1 n=1 Tax=Toxocara canis TaxID=6265 RepID=A0A0B2V6J9_TOXCA|nr:Extracellular sulfatase Sulf-1 [Toxocara canis]
MLQLANELRDLGELSNTYIIYTSDHGYHLGQFGLVKGKNMPYEFDIRVPYFIRGPGLPKNLTIRWPVMNVDIAPTILDMAGVEPPSHMEGRSLLPLMHQLGKYSAELANELRDLGELSNTYIIYTSDHGYHLGQFGLVKGKNMPYEFDIRVPYFIRGPGLPKNLTIRWPVMNVDIAPTILDMAGVEPPSHMEGRSLLPLMHHISGSRRKRVSRENDKEQSPVNWRHTVLIERGKMAKLTKIRDRLQRQRDRFGKDVRVQQACTRPEFRHPCVHDQQWKCIRDDAGKWRIFKCHESLEVAKECECRSNSTHEPIRRRHRRTRTTHSAVLARKKPKEISYRRIATMAKLDEEGQSVNVDDKLSSRWEDEFIHFIQQKEILESGQWFQGVFEDNFEHEKRMKRSLKESRKKRKRERELNIGPMCTHSNTTILCEPIVFEDSKLWAMHKTKVDDRIDNLRRRLSAFKDVRRALKRGRPLADEPAKAENNSENCKCSTPQAHPLQADADINAFGERRHREGRNKDVHRKDHEYGTKKWLREDTKQNCNVPQMNCFVHGADHWRTPPLWPALYGEFCFCQNSNNNTYWCLRTVNQTHNFLYCEFITEFISFYDLNADPYQLHNSVWSIPVRVLEQLSNQLERLRTCRGRAECEHYSSPLWNTPFIPSKNDIT